MSDYIYFLFWFFPFILTKDLSKSILTDNYEARIFGRKNSKKSINLQHDYHLKVR